jgi:hypothetical protein
VTKSERIRRLYADGFLTVAEIANLVGCLPEYVRVVARQRKDGSVSASDRRYLENGGREKQRQYFAARYRNDPQFRAKRDALTSAYRTKRYRTDPVFRAKELARSLARYHARRQAEAHQ